MRPFTRSCFLLLVLGRLFLLALPLVLGIFLRSTWSPLFFPHAPALIFLCLAKVQLSLTLTLSPLTIWYFRLTALFLLAKSSFGVLANCSLCGTEANSFLFSRPSMFNKCKQVFPLKPAPFCTLFAGLGSTIKSAISLLFSYYLILVPSLPSCPLLHLLPQTLWQIWQELLSLSSCSIRLQ